MPPTGADERAYALHVLSVVAAARALAASIASAGGAGRVKTPDPQTVETLCTEVGKLVVYETRAGVRGTIRPFTEETLIEAVDGLRRKRELTLDQEDVLATTDEDADSLFRLDAEPENIESDFSLGDP
jgi:hypothetical protein